MAGNFGVAIRRNKAVLILVDNDGYSLEEYQCLDFGVAHFEGCVSFLLENQLYFCIKKTLYQFIKNQRTWKKLSYDMKIVRYGAACVSLKEGTIIAGGCEFDGEVEELKDSCFIITNQGDNLISTRIGKLPAKVKYHTLTKVSNNSFIVCGGIDVNGQETPKVYMGTLMKSTCNTPGVTSESPFFIIWVTLPRMCKSRSGHFSMFVDNRLYVFGGTLLRNEKEEVLERSLVECGLKADYSRTSLEVLPLRVKGNDVGTRDESMVGKWKIRHMMYDISFASLVLSPDEKYGVIAGGEICGCRNLHSKNIEIFEKYTQLTMNTHNLVMRSLEDKDQSLHTKNIFKMILSCTCMAPMYDDVDREYEASRFIHAVYREIDEIPSLTFPL